VPGWVTVFERVNQLGAESGTTQPGPALCTGWNEYPPRVWVTVFGRVNHLGAEPDTQASLSRPRLNEYPA